MVHKIRYFKEHLNFFVNTMKVNCVWTTFTFNVWKKSTLKIFCVPKKKKLLVPSNMIMGINLTIQLHEFPSKKDVGESEKNCLEKRWKLNMEVEQLNTT